MIYLRQLADRVRHRLLLVPVALVVFSVLLSQGMLAVDRRVDGDSLPSVLLTTVDSGRSILTAIAGGLISSVTLLLSMMLVAVQLASSQFSPRTVRNWIGDRTQQIAIGVVLGTAVFCLLILRETRSFGEGEGLTPHLSVLLALVLGVTSLIAVVRSVDHLTNQLRIGSVASGIMNETVRLIDQEKRLRTTENPGLTPAGRPSESNRPVDPPEGAQAIEAATSGWVQQIDQEVLFKAIPKGSTVYVPVSLGSFVPAHTPLAWVWPKIDADNDADAIRNSFALGDGRTLQQDIGFGIVQLVDIALRALSPGVNDPNTANDIIVHLGVVMLAVWDTPVGVTVREEDDRSMIRQDLDHADYLQAAFGSIRRYGASDPDVCSTLLRVLGSLRSETIRRGFDGPLEPISELAAQVLAAVEGAGLAEHDEAAVRALALAIIDA